MFETILYASQTTYNDFMQSASVLAPKVLWAVLILIVWGLLARWTYLLIVYLFKKFKVIELLNKLQIDFNEENTQEKVDKILWETIDVAEPKKKSVNFFWEKVKIDSIVAKAVGYYVFLVFFRIAIKYIWILEIEEFLNSVIWYLPKLFIWVVIWFFWVRFANFTHDIIFHTLDLTKQKNAKVVAVLWKIIILFFTTLAVLNHIEIVDKIIYHTILIWFISMISLAWWLAFWLWWKEVAKDILESFKN